MKVDEGAPFVLLKRWCQILDCVIWTLSALSSYLLLDGPTRVPHKASLTRSPDLLAATLLSRFTRSLRAPDFATERSELRLRRLVRTLLVSTASFAVEHISGEVESNEI